MYTYFKEHDVLAQPNIIKIAGFEFLFDDYFYITALLEIVVANNNMCDVPEQVIIEMW